MKKAPISTLLENQDSGFVYVCTYGTYLFKSISIFMSGGCPCILR